MRFIALMMFYSSQKRLTVIQEILRDMTVASLEFHFMRNRLRDGSALNGTMGPIPSLGLAVTAMANSSRKQRLQGHFETQAKLLFIDEAEQIVQLDQVERRSGSFDSAQPKQLVPRTSTNCAIKHVTSSFGARWRVEITRGNFQVLQPEYRGAARADMYWLLLL